MPEPATTCRNLKGGRRRNTKVEHRRLPGRFSDRTEPGAGKSDQSRKLAEVLEAVGGGSGCVPEILKELVRSGFSDCASFPMPTRTEHPNQFLESAQQRLFFFLKF